jgi:putative acetyltransferase
MVRRERADQPDVAPLIEASDAFASALYPPESNHFVDIAALCDPTVVFLVARTAGRAIGCGAVLRDPRGWGEIKRMFVDAEARGQKIGMRILAELERIAAAEGLRLLRLETGIHSAGALATYRRAGYRECPPFGDYCPDPFSVFMEKRLDPSHVGWAKAPKAPCPRVQATIS